MKTREPKKASQKTGKKASTPKRAGKMAAEAKGPKLPIKKKSSAQAGRGVRECAPHFISRQYLSPSGKREVSSRRLAKAIKAVREAHAYKLEI
jgi:hypothetical protein